MYVVFLSLFFCFFPSLLSSHPLPPFLSLSFFSFHLSPDQVSPVFNRILLNSNSTSPTWDNWKHFQIVKFGVRWVDHPGTIVWKHLSSPWLNLLLLFFPVYFLILVDTVFFWDGEVKLWALVDLRMSLSHSMVIELCLCIPTESHLSLDSDVSLCSLAAGCRILRTILRTADVWASLKSSGLISCHCLRYQAIVICSKV